MLSSTSRNCRRILGVAGLAALAATFPYDNVARAEDDQAVTPDFSLGPSEPKSRSNHGRLRLIPGEPAELILELMEKTPSSVLHQSWLSSDEEDDSVTPIFEQGSPADTVVGLVREWARDSSTDSNSAVNVTQSDTCSEACAECDEERAKPVESEYVVQWQPSQYAAADHALRDASQRLSRLALEMESQGHLAEADQLHDMAHRFRSQARGQDGQLAPLLSTGQPGHDPLVELRREIASLRHEVQALRAAADSQSSGLR